MAAPAPDAKFYHDRKMSGVSNYEKPLLSLKGLKVGLLATVATANSANEIKQSLAKDGVQLIVVAELLGPGVDMTYSSADAVNFDGVVVAPGAHHLFSSNANASSLYPAGRPQQILVDSYRYGKPVGFMAEDRAMREANIKGGPGVYYDSAARTVLKRGYNGTEGGNAYNSTTAAGAAEVTNDMARSLKEGLKQFKFLDRFPVDFK